jgi:hypothetical protein
MATYAAKLRSTAVDNSSILINPNTGAIYNGSQRQPFGARESASVFYVDGNVVSSGDGLTWGTAFKTLTEGLAAAHSYQSTSANRAWAHRATVYACGDSLTEDLIILAEKTDIIGVGSTNAMDRCELIGNHVPVTTNCWGTRWYNFQFKELDAGAMWTLTSVSSGLKFIGCTFSVREAALATIGVLWTATFDLEIAHCLFDAYPSGFSTAAISIGAGTSDKIQIHDNYILSAIGILVNASYAQTAGNLHIDNNVFHCSTLCIDDNSDLALVTNNQMVSSATIGANMYNLNVALAAGNIATGSDNTLDVPIKAV